MTTTETFSPEFFDAMSEEGFRIFGLDAEPDIDDFDASFCAGWEL